MRIKQLVSVNMVWIDSDCRDSHDQKSIIITNSFCGIPFSFYILIYVLSDGNKRFLYDVGVYDCDDDDDENGMGDFLNEMTAMMSQSKSDENGKKESFEELQELYNELFESDTPCSSSAVGLNSTGINSGDRRAEIASPFQGFCFGSSEPHQGGESSRRKNTRKGRRW
ncbi:hypothetical protein ABFS83_09G121000 [Erythranthe nasuta]